MIETQVFLDSEDTGGLDPEDTIDSNEAEPVPLILLPCSSCSRTFRPEALAKHSKVCEKTLMKKRKQFDSSKQRLQGTDVPVFPPAPKPAKESPLAKTNLKSKWRDKPGEGSKPVVMRKRSDGSPAVKPSDHEQCPYCERSFGPKAFERHTDWCKEQHFKIKQSTNTTNEALRERLQYRAPLTNKILTRDKYQPRSRDPSPMSYSRAEESPKVLRRSTSLRMSQKSKPAAAMKLNNSASQIRSSRVHSSANNLTSSHTETDGPHKGEPQKPKIYGSGTTKKPFPQVVRHVIATVLPKRFSMKEVEKYDPFASAEQQMLELFGAQPHVAPDDTPQSFEPVKSPPLSAFAIFTPINKNRASSSDNLKLENRDNNNDSDDTGSPPNEKIDNRKNFSLSNLSLCSIISIDSVDGNRNPVGKYTRGEGMTRSMSAVETKSRNRVKVNMQQMLYGTHRSPEDPASPEPTDVGNLEACEAELLVSMLEFEKMLNSSPIPSFKSPVESESPKSPEEFSKKIQPPVDSAYSSLTRASGEGDVKADPPRFCHECGSQYPVSAAKFCCNCGVKRVAI